MKVGFIGLGNLGQAMVGRLQSESVDLVVWNRTLAKARATGLPVADSPAELASRCDTVLLNLFDSQAVRDVLAGTDGLLAGGLKGKLIADTTTNHFRDVLEFHSMVNGKGGQYLEAPVLGSVVPATQGTLTILISGSTSAFDSAQPLLEKLGKNLFFVATPGLASRMKLINNLVLGTVMGVLAEATSFAEKSGLSREQALEILAAGAGNSAILNAKRQILLTGDFSPHFSIAAIYKDLRYMEDLLKDLSATSEFRSGAEALFRQATEAGLADMDFSAVYKVVSEKK
jgi:3-hydroxyisobutyrate dehydrogenase